MLSCCTHSLIGASWPAISAMNILSHQLITRPIEVVGGCAHCVFIVDTSIDNQLLRMAYLAEEYTDASR
jgi:hypothetical protein